MEKKFRLLLLLALLLTAATGAWAQGSGTKIYSVDFSDYTSYPFYNASESATVENGLLVLTNSQVYAEKYEVQPEIGRPTPITSGKCYRIAIQYKTTVGGPVNVVLGPQDWSTMMGAWWVPITVSDNFQTLEATFLKCSYGATDNHILFQFGDLVGTVYIKKVEVYEFDYVDVTGVTLSSSTASVNVGDKVALTATVAPDNATEKTVKWSVGGTNADAVKLYTDEACTTEVGSDATSALTVYAKGLSAGEATVTVVASSDETKSATCTVTVAEPTYTVSMKDGVKDADKWTVKVGEGQAQALPIGGLKGDGSETVTLQYNGRLKVKGVKATSDAAPAAPSFAADEYNEASWDGTNKKVVFEKKKATTTPVAVADANTNVTWSDGWYTVSGNVTITGNVTLGADTHLILQDGATLTINGQLNCRANKKNLYIYGQEKGDGKLNVTNNGAEAINSDMNYRIDIHGGEVTAAATGNKRSGLNTGYLAVYGGKLTATSGGGNGINFQNTFDVYGGEVEATSNATSSSSDLCGIRSGGGTSSQILTVYGGKVTATGNGVTNISLYGSGIRCYVKSGTSGIKFYFSEDGNTWDEGTSYASATSVGRQNDDAATKKRYAKATSDEEPAAVSLIVDPVVGQVIGSDGKNYDANATLPDGVTAVAKICYVGSDNGEDAPYNHGLALALSDANGGSTIQWGYSTTTDNSQHPNYSNSSFTSESGLQYNNAAHNSDNYKAFKAAMANNGTAAPTDCSDWFLASGYQWTKMIAGAGSAGNLKSLAGLTNNYYWTGSENSAGKAWRYEFNKTRFYTVYKNQSESWVRACLAF